MYCWGKNAYHFAKKLTRFYVLVYVCLAFTPSFTASSQPVTLPLPEFTEDITSPLPVDTLLTILAEMQQERAVLQRNVRRLNQQIAAMEQNFQTNLDQLSSGHQAINLNIDSLQATLPTGELFQDTNSQIQFLNRRQDSLNAYIQRLHTQIESLPDNHYWGVRNNFAQFDHLMLFTFLGGVISLGVFLLTQGKEKVQLFEMNSPDYIEQETDRLSVSITLIVGSIILILFILFIL